MKDKINRMILAVALLGVCGGTSVLAQNLSEKFPHRTITAEEIRQAGEQPFQDVLHYLVPDVFPKTDQAWLRTINTMTLYVNHKKFEPEFINTIHAGDVKRILIWEQPWEPSPMSYPALASVKYVVSIETVRKARGV